MALEKVENINLFLRIRKFVLGKEKPDILTRTSIIVGFLVWIYLFSWHLATFLSMVMMDTVKQPQIIKAAFQRVGSREYGYGDTINRLLVHSILELIIYGIIAVGLVLIYRKKRLGFLLYIFAYVATFLATYFILGWRYLSNEVNYVDTLLILFGIVYFAIGLFVFYKRPNEVQVVK